MPGRGMGASVPSPLESLRRALLGAARFLLRAVPFALFLCVGLLGILLGSGHENALQFTVQEPGENIVEDAFLQDSSLYALAQRFDAQVPFLSDRGWGTVEPIAWPGGKALLLTWEDQEHRVTQAVRPASAAQALLREELSVVPTTGYSVASLPALCCAGQGGVCLYFSNGTAAFSLWLPGAAVQNLEATLPAVSFTPFF